MPRRPKIFAAFFLVLFLAQGLVLIRATSPTTDEVAFHMVNGYAYLKTHDYRMSPANPALLRQWMALPWLFFKPKLDLNKISWREADSVPFAVDFFYRDNRQIANKLLYSARVMNLLLGFALALLVYAWSRRLYGEWAGILSLAFYTLCPNFLAYSSIAHTDIGVTLFITLTGFGLWKFLISGQKKDFVLFAVAFGFACAAKQNALVFFVPFLAVLLLKKRWSDFFKSAFWLPISAFIIIWASYGFEFKPLLWEGVPRIGEKLSYVAAFADKLFPGNSGIKELLRNASRSLPVPIPSYLLGFAGLVRSHQDPYTHYAFGQWITGSVWYFYFFSFAAKMTLPFLGLLIVRAVYFQKAGSSGGHENAVVLLPTAFLSGLTMFDSTGIGIRYLFPFIPMLFVWIGGLAKLAQTGKSVWKWALVTLIVLNAVTVWPAFPNYLSYFNPAVGGVEKGLYLTRGSDVDWGQGLKALKTYLDRQGISKISLRYFGTADPSFYGIDYEPVTETETERPEAKVYAVSIFFREHMKWCDRIKPDALVGGSIHVYDLRKKPQGSVF